VRFFIDECISPSLSRHLNESGLHDAIHPRDRGRLREPDYVIFARAVAEDRTIVTENEEDFRKLAAGVDLHPGLIILPSVARLEAQRLMDMAIDYLRHVNVDRPQDLLVNSVLTITLTGSIRIDPLP
jgi:predicted nuclease of predicted toxin-antitoxin system